MIETREDYEIFKAHSLTIWKNDAVETIEALREVARAMEVDEVENTIHFNHDDLIEAYLALPPWLLEEPNAD